MTHQKTKTATIWTLSPGKRVATVSAQLEDDRWIVYCGNVRISNEMRHRHNADKLARETAYFEETGRNYDYDHNESPSRTTRRRSLHGQSRYRGILE